MFKNTLYILLHMFLYYVYFTYILNIRIFCIFVYLVYFIYIYIFCIFVYYVYYIYSIYIKMCIFLYVCIFCTSYIFYIFVYFVSQGSKGSQKGRKALANQLQYEGGELSDSSDLGAASMRGVQKLAAP